MVQIWYIDDNESTAQEDQTIRRSERHLNPPTYLSLDELRQKTGVLYEPINVENIKSNENMNEICVQKGYHYSDVLDIHPDRLNGYNQILHRIYTEHIHTYDEVRIVLVGSAYFDVRDLNDQWIRISVRKGEMLTVPAGGYHRFTLDANGYCKLFRLNAQPEWSSINRPADAHPVRIAYLRKAINGF